MRSSARAAASASPSTSACRSWARCRFSRACARAVTRVSPVVITHPDSIEAQAFQAVAKAIAAQVSILALQKQTEGLIPIDSLMIEK